MLVMLVYGTLRPGIAENVVKMKGRMYDMGGYPGVLLDETSDDEIVVERCEVEDRRLPMLDSYEGYDARRPYASLFLREEVEDPFKPGEKAFLYVYNFRDADELDFTRVRDGDWLRHRGHRSGTAADMMGFQVPYPRRVLEAVTNTHNGPPEAIFCPDSEIPCGCRPEVVPVGVVLEDDLSVDEVEYH